MLKDFIAKLAILLRRNAIFVSDYLHNYGIFLLLFVLLMTLYAQSRMD